MRVLVTGSTGFIGCAFGRYAVREGHTVIGTARAVEPNKDWPAPYKSCNASAEALTSLINEYKPNLVFHGAGTASVADSLADPLNDFSGSVQLFANVLEALRRSDQHALLIFPSSAAVYGNPRTLPVSEDAAIQPISPYGFHKAICEMAAREYAECFDLKIIVCRLFSVFGFAQRRLLLWELFKQLSGPGAVVSLEGSGGESRDFLHVDDAVSAMLLLTNAFEGNSRANRFQIVNVASGSETSIADVASQMRDLVAPGKEIRFHGASRRGDPLNWRADISQLNLLLSSWKSTLLHEALKTCVSQWQQQSAAFQHVA